MGQAARILKNNHSMKVGRISGLDPAYPCFESESALLRLKESDAEFVDVIHTNGEPGINPNLGMYERIGKNNLCDFLKFMKL